MSDACLHIVFSQFGVGREEVGKIGILSRVGEDTLHGDACPLNHRLSGHDFRILGNPCGINVRVLGHRAFLRSTRRC
jgi:hypothetical protein